MFLRGDMPAKVQRDNKPNRARAGRRWSPDEEARLVALAEKGYNSAAIAAILTRTFSSVQNRLRQLGRSTAEPDDPKEPKRDQRPMDLSCGAVSNGGRAVVESIWGAIRDDSAIVNRREPSRLSSEVQSVIGAIVREAIISTDAKNGLARVAISRVRAETVGVGSGVFRNLLQALERQRFLQRSLGYPDTLKIDSALAKNGRVSFLRAMPRLLELCARFDIRTDNIATHFPSLGQPFRCA
jgi:transposase-like protein